MKQQSAGFVNPFRNISFAFVLRQAVAALAGIVPSSTLSDSHGNRSWRSARGSDRLGRELRDHQTDGSPPRAEARTTLASIARFS
jgi:hypothetical protein